MPSRLVIYMLAMSCLAFPSLTAAAQEQEREPFRRTISLIGTGEVRARPDIAIVTLGVMKRAATAREALTANNQAMAEIIAHLQRSGVDEKDIQTSNFTVNPAYQYDNQGQQPPKIIGYDVSNQVTAIVRKLDALGTILDEAVSKGSNQIYGISFSIDDPTAREDEARKLAIEDATRKARLITQSAGVALGPILNIQEMLGQPPIPLHAKAQRMETAADGSVPVAQGEHVITVQVNVSWEIH
jgi:uncharacterized protein YggE